MVSDLRCEIVSPFVAEVAISLSGGMGGGGEVGSVMQGVAGSS